MKIIYLIRNWWLRYQIRSLDNSIDELADWIATRRLQIDDANMQMMKLQSEKFAKEKNYVGR